MATCVKFLLDIAYKKLLELASVSRSCSKNKSCTFCMDHSVGIPCSHSQSQSISQDSRA